MPIAIYRHYKLHVAVPKVVKEGAMTELNVAKLEQRTCGAYKLSLSFLRRRVIKKQNEIRQVTWLIGVGRFDVRVSRRDQLERDEGQMLSLEPLPPLVNLAWTFNGQETHVYEQLEDMNSRSVIEMYLHNTLQYPEEYNILTYDFNPNRKASEPYKVMNPVRNRTDAFNASLDNAGETPDDWLRLFMGE